MISVRQSVASSASKEFVGIDVAQDAIEHEHRDNDDGQAERKADPAEADLAVEEVRAAAQCLQHAALRTGCLRIHSEFRSAPSPQAHQRERRPH